MHTLCHDGHEKFFSRTWIPHDSRQSQSTKLSPSRLGDGNREVRLGLSLPVIQHLQNCYPWDENYASARRIIQESAIRSWRQPRRYLISNISGLTTPPHFWNELVNMSFIYPLPSKLFSLLSLPPSHHHEYPSKCQNDIAIAVSSPSNIRRK